MKFKNFFIMFAVPVALPIIGCTQKQKSPLTPPPTINSSKPSPNTVLNCSSQQFDSQIKSETLRQLAELCGKLGYRQEIVDSLNIEADKYTSDECKLDDKTKEEIRQRVLKEEANLSALQFSANSAIKNMEEDIGSKLGKIKKEIQRGGYGYLDDPIYFDFGSSCVCKEIDKKRLRLFAETMIAANFPLIIVLSGHTDPIGTEESNKILSQKRAEAVASILIDSGMPNKNIRIEIYGETELVVPGAGGSKLGAFQNRRVTFGIDY